MNHSSSDAHHQQMPLLRINHRKHVLKTLHEAYMRKLLFDIILNVNGTEYQAHRFILGCHSEFFRILFTSNSWTECKTTCISLKESDECAAVFKDMLAYFYTGNIKLRVKEVFPLLRLADKYNVAGLTPECCSFMSQTVTEAVTNGVIMDWFQYSLMFQSHLERRYSRSNIWIDTTKKLDKSHITEWTILSKECRNFIKWNIELVGGDNFDKLDPDAMISLLQQNDLVVKNEMAIFNMAVKWLETRFANGDIKMEGQLWWRCLYEDAPRDSGREYMEEMDEEELAGMLTKAVMNGVKFHAMNAHEITDLLLHPMVQGLKEFFMEKFGIAVAIQKSIRSCFHQELRVVFEPSPANELIRKVYLSFAQWKHDLKDNVGISAHVSEERNVSFLTPRLYINDEQSSFLIIERFDDFPPFQCRTLMFNTNHCEAVACDYTLTTCNFAYDWMIDFYPKGMYFGPGVVIGVWQGTQLVPEFSCRMARMVITCKSQIPKRGLLVRIAVLAYGVKQNREQVVETFYCMHRFRKNNGRLTIKNILPFLKNERPQRNNGGNEKGTNYCYLTGESKDTLKLKISMIPILTKTCYLEAPYQSVNLHCEVPLED